MLARGGGGAESEALDQGTAQVEVARGMQTYICDDQLPPILIGVHPVAMQNIVDPHPERLVPVGVDVRPPPVALVSLPFASVYPSIRKPFLPNPVGARTRHAPGKWVYLGFSPVKCATRSYKLPEPKLSQVKQPVTQIPNSSRPI